jgi:PAS domain S-box-containing protein
MDTAAALDNGQMKPTSNKDTVLYGRVTKKKAGEIIPLHNNLRPSKHDYRESFRSAFEFSGIGMALVATDGRILDANNALCNFLGYSKPELLRYSLLDLGHPDDNDNDLKLMDRMMANFLNHYSLEKRYISKQNTILWGMHTVSKVFNNTGEVDHYVVQIVDTTKRKNLADRLNRQNSELEAIRTGLINRIKTLEELNHIIAHNLRGPANNISLLVEMLKDRVNQKDDDNGLDLAGIVEYLKEGSASLVSSLNTLIDVAQLSMTKDIPFDDCNVYQITHEILDQLNSTIFETGAFVQLSMEIPNVRYPRVFLESILYNLISNALKYISPNRIPDILVRTYSENGRTVISVKDNGLGIDLVKYGHRLFKLNQVFHKNTNSRGVGLYITKVQVESFGGTIQVKSRENEGSEFIVTL